MPKGAVDAHVWGEWGATPGDAVPGGSPGSSPEKSSMKGGGLSPTLSRRKGTRVPEKVGRVGGRAILGSRPVLRDIVNDAS